MKTKDLEHLIDLYFDGQTTLAEEKILRATLASTQADSPKIEEAKAVLGFLSMEKKSKTRIATPSHKKIGLISAAAGIALVLGIGLFAMFSSSIDPYEAIALNDGAYINGEKVEASSALALMESEMQIFIAANENISENISDEISAMQIVFSE